MCHEMCISSDFAQSANFMRLLQPAYHSNHAAAFAWRGESLVQNLSLTKIQVTLDSITVRWEAPQRLPQEANEISYTLAYASQAEDGSLGNFVEVANLNDTTAVIDGLAMDTQYALKAKVNYKRQSMNESMWLQVLTNKGTSEFSQTLTIRTMSDQTDLGKFEDQVMGKFYFPWNSSRRFHCSQMF